ncbi:hypothetical protein [Paucisalibacillus sp. EB02]|uniref:hypothetical protein n=1 Tax=Paucisalibacillus sp. EB02 TaxID=1347087 RepID=UPI0004B230B7|nr:hypothetical protein [Paucisalibacillus sp. EB02]
MGLAILKEKDSCGGFRKDFEEALLQLSDIARLAEQKLSLKVDNHIQEQYRKQNQEIHHLTEIVNSLQK